MKLSSPPPVKLMPVLLKLLGKARIDPGGHEIFGLALLRILDAAGDPGFGHDQLVDPMLLEMGAELAVGDRLDPVRLLNHPLDQQDRQHRGDDVPDVEAGLPVHVPPPGALL